MATPLGVLQGDGRLGPALPRPFRLAVDLDNTLICYDQVFVAVALDRGLVAAGFSGGKQAVRDHIRQLPDGETLWQQVQGEVYGKRIGSALLFEGAEQFLRRCRTEGAHVWVVSHKTQFNAYDPDRVDLRAAALEWLEARVFADGELGLSRDDVFFETTRRDKIARLARLRCTHVIDDLVEVFSDPDFPSGMLKIRFDPARATGDGSWASWPEIEEELFGPARPAPGNGAGVNGRSV
jgi:hypothetical protein